jgi:hypothetical protein
MVEESFLGHLLVVDDDRTLLTILSSTLEKYYTASSGEARLKTVSALYYR